MVSVRKFLIGCVVFLIGGVGPCGAAEEQVVKSRKLVFKGDPKGLDWAARGSLTKTASGMWIATHSRATHHGRTVPRLVTIHTSNDEGRTWSKPNCFPDGKAIKGAPLSAEHKRVELTDGCVLTCPNGDLLYVTMSKDHDGLPVRGYQMRTLQWRSTDNGASWRYEGRCFGIHVGETFALGKAVEGDSIYITALGTHAPQEGKAPWQVVLFRSNDHGFTWERLSAIGEREDRINETGVVCVDEKTIMVVGRTFGEKTTKMRISRDGGKTWGPFTDITKGVQVVQQPKLTKFPKEPGRIYLTGRERIEETKQRNGLWYTDDVGKTWTKKVIDDRFSKDSGYGEILKRKNGDFYYLGYRGTDDVADLWEFVLRSDYKQDLAGQTPPPK